MQKQTENRPPDAFLVRRAVFRFFFLSPRNGGAKKAFLWMEGGGARELFPLRRVKKLKSLKKGERTVKKQTPLLIGALIVLCAFFLHIAAMRPSEEALCRAEALEYLIAQDDPAALETFAPWLVGEAELHGDLPPGEADERVGERMLRESDRLYYLRPGSTQTVVFEMKQEE